jgi:hypothetical protein
MAFAAEIHLDRLEEAVAEFRLALQQPLLIKMRVLSTDEAGVSCSAPAGSTIWITNVP